MDNGAEYETGQAHMYVSMTSLNNCSGLLVVKVLGNIHVYS